MKKVLVPIDFSNNAEKAVAYAAEIAKLSKGIVATGILYFTENLGADMIIMGTHGASGLKEVFRGN